MKKVLILLIFVIVLAASVLFAPLRYAIPDSDSFSTYPEFLDCAEDFSKHLDSGLTGIAFNLDDESSALNKTYYVNYVRTKYYFLDSYRPINYSRGIGFAMSFYMVDTECFNNDSQYSYFIQVNSIDRIPDNMNINGEIEYITSNVSESSASTDGLGNYFNYSNLFQINIDNAYAGYVRIWSVNEITKEKIDEIYQLLIGNIVFYG